MPRGIEYTPPGLVWKQEKESALKFVLIDKILEAEPGRRIKALKVLSMGEEYLGDHFPGNPIMPGVLMMEAMVETASWLVRLTEGFVHSMVTLKEARNIKYVHFISPGDRLTIEATMMRSGDGQATFKAAGSVEGNVVVSSRFDLEVYDLADRKPELAGADGKVLEAMKSRFQVLAVEEVRALLGKSTS